MTTREFMVKAWNGQTRKKECSSVFYENGVLYSYGYHYPLVFNVAGLTIRNVSGYSVTTSKHIQWSRDIEALDVHAGRNFRLRGSDQEILSELMQGQSYHCDYLAKQLASKKRTDTQIYKFLSSKLAKANEVLQTLTEARVTA